jgi:chitinase domain-containing protein 1
VLFSDDVNLFFWITWSIQDIGKALLPVAVTSKALPAPAEASPEPAAADSSVQNAEAAPQINSAPKTEAKAEPVSGFSRPLSPYPTVIPSLIALVYFHSGYFPSSS